ncbi:MAG: hypothetical protein MZV70_02660 [Desulfobacterales bacterium]|nr:hypothetical protein [Desulfobacterales bacterium]
MAEVNEVLGSVHYQWKGSAAEMTSGAASQGKLVQSTAGSSAMNAYCINVLGNFPAPAGAVTSASERRRPRPTPRTSTVSSATRRTIRE